VLDTSGLLIEFSTFVDDRGRLVVGERPRSLPFEVLRFFLIQDVPVGTSRGGHAHRRLHQFLIATSGRVQVDLTDGRDEATVILDRRAVGLWVPPLVWATEEYLDSDSVLLVLASESFDASEYIDTLEEMRQLRNQPND
jgi:UDP-2-acetamido-3-amino-2,3-dideoxy-glucuronate N-acetyltransferase